MKNNGIITGYIKIYSPNHPFAKKGYILEHRLAVEKKIGRYLKPEECIHHLNEIREDNRIENLMLFKNNKEHMKFHTKIKQFGMTTPIRRQIENRWIDLKHTKEEWAKYQRENYAKNREKRKAQMRTRYKKKNSPEEKLKRVLENAKKIY